MKTISPYEALQENEYVVATVKKPRHIYGLYPTEDEARRKIFGIWSPNVNGKMWLVKWVSPFRKPGLMVIIR